MKRSKNIVQYLTSNTPLCDKRLIKKNSDKVLINKSKAYEVSHRQRNNHTVYADENSYKEIDSYMCKIKALKSYYKKPISIKSLSKERKTENISEAIK